MSMIFNWDGRRGSLLDNISKVQGTLTAGTGGFKKTEKGMAMLFDGSATKILTGAFSSVSNIVSISLWIKTNKNNTSVDNGIFGQWDTNGMRKFLIAQEVTTNKIVFLTSPDGSYAAGNTVSSTSAINDGKWHHIIAIHDGSYNYLYIDGILDNSGDVDDGLYTTTTPISSGAIMATGSPLGSSFYGGYIGSAKLYNTALTQAEQNELMTEFLNSYGTEEQKRNFVYPKATDLSSEVDSVVGEQLVVNGGFDTDTWWTKEDGWEIDNGVASYDGNTNAASLSQVDATLSSPMKDDTKYKLSFTISNASTHARLYILDASGGVVYVSSTIYQNGKHIIEFTSPSTTVSTGGGISFYAYDSGSSFDIDDITVQEVTGLVAAYNMIPSKGKLIDISGQGNNGTITGALSTKDGMAFDGVDDYVEVTSFTGIDTGTNNYSNSMRVNMKEIGKEQHLAEFSGTQVALNSANRLFMIGASNPLSSSSVTIPLGEHTFTFVVKNPGAAIYVDGNLYLENDDYTEAVTVETLTIGGYYGGGSYYFKGDIQDLKIYNYAFTPQQAKDYHNSFIKPTLIETFKDTGADGIVKTPKGWM